MRGRAYLLAAAAATLAVAVPGARSATRLPVAPKYGIFQQTLSVAARGSAPWDDTSVTVRLTAPSGRRYTIGAFYQPGRWAFRFAPPEVGIWRWSAGVTGGSLGRPSSGRFRVARSGLAGFVRSDPSNLGRWQFANGAPYYAIGLNDCSNEQSATAKTWGLDGGIRIGVGHNPKDLVTAATYLRAYQAAGFNLFRWGPDNCSFSLYSKIDPSGNAYSFAGMDGAERLIRTLRSYGFRIEFVLFGSTPPFASSSDATQLASVDRYVKYVVDRFGAYVDFWELANEASPSDAWLTQVGGYLERIDPYHHPVGTSWSRPQLGVMQFGSDHWYQDESAADADAVAWTRLRNEPSLSLGKPTLVDEQGNTGQNWDPTSALRMRLRAWTAFFAKGTLVFWNTSFIKNCCPNGTSSIYLGPEERRYIRSLQRYTKGFDLRAAIASANTAPGGAARAYALRGPRTYGMYVVAAGDRTRPTTGVTATVDPVRPGTATWMDPSTGKILSRARVRAGRQTLAVPAFTTDIALKIVG